MKNVMRFSLSGLLGMTITAVLFIGMLALLSDPKKLTSTPDLLIQFNFVEAEQPIKEQPPQKRKIPEPQPVTQAPAAPSFPSNLDANKSIDMPLPNINSPGLNELAKISIPGTGVGTGGMTDHPGGLASGVAPMYPQQQLFAKTEGWVEVLIKVNKLGRVSEVDILNAKPARVFNAATLKAVKKWRFHPKTIDGKAVPYQVRQKIDFKIDPQ